MADQRKRGGWTLAVWLGLGLVVLYTVSIGPAWRAWRSGWLQASTETIDAFYRPLERTAERAGLDDELNAYITWCEP